MEILLKAIKTLYATDAGAAFVALRAANTGGLYTEVHSQEQSYPYIVLHHITSVPDFTMGLTEIKTAIVQFSICHNLESPTALMDILPKLKAAFDNATLTYMADTHLAMLRVLETGPIKDSDFWQVTVDYQAMRQA